MFLQTAVFSTLQFSPNCRLCGFGSSPTLSFPCPGTLTSVRRAYSTVGVSVSLDTSQACHTVTWKYTWVVCILQTIVYNSFVCTLRCKIGSRMAACLVLTKQMGLNILISKTEYFRIFLLIQRPHLFWFRWSTNVLSQKQFGI